VHYFFSSNRIQFLGIDGIFNRATVDGLNELFDNLRVHRLWGLSVGGRLNANFAGSIPSFLAALDKLKDLACLHIDGQLLTKSDANAVILFLSRHTHIKAFSCDNAIADPSVLVSFYQRLDKYDLHALGPPLRDAERAFKGGCAIPGFEAFRDAVRRPRPIASPTARAYYFSLRGGQRTLDELYRISARFPKVVADFAKRDPFSLAERSEQRAWRSLHSVRVSTMFKTLHELQESIVTSPHRLARPAKRAQSAPVGPAPELGIEPFAAAPELREMLMDLVEELIKPDITGEIVTIVAVERPELALMMAYGKPIAVCLPEAISVPLLKHPRLGKAGT
jgi:hypothetical protein